MSDYLTRGKVAIHFTEDQKKEKLKKIQTAGWQMDGTDCQWVTATQHHAGSATPPPPMCWVVDLPPTLYLLNSLDGKR